MKNSKILLMLFIFIITLWCMSLLCYAEDEAFHFELDTKDVILNGQRWLAYTGGTGSITWESSDESIATVDNGTVRGLKIGTATITATRGSEMATCTVNVVYNSLTIGGNQYETVSSVNLILGEHPTETLTSKVEDDKYEEVSSAVVTWTSSDTSVVTVDSSTGKLQAIKEGTATITASAAGVTDTCEVKVFAAPIFTDFSNAKYNTTFNGIDETTLQITGITPNNDDYTNYYYIITPNNTKPNISKTSYGYLDQDNMNTTVESFSVNNNENYIYTRKISKYAELNQDMYIWIIQTTGLSDNYYDENGNYVSYATKFVVEGEKLTRPELPKLNLILQTFNIGAWNNTTSNEEDNYIHFNFPTTTENRKFTLKIGKITDKSILSKIQNNDYTGITELLAYAKSHDAIYTKILTTTSEAYFRSDTALFDGNKLLDNEAYYYIYVQFDDENGTYYPIEGVTLGQAWISSTGNAWDLWAYTSSDFKWENLNSGSGDPTIAKDNLPDTGNKIYIITIILVGLAISGFISYRKNKNIKIK